MQRVLECNTVVRGRAGAGMLTAFCRRYWCSVTASARAQALSAARVGGSGNLNWSNPGEITARRTWQITCRPQRGTTGSNHRRACAVDSLSRAWVRIPRQSM